MKFKFKFLFAGSIILLLMAGASKCNNENDRQDNKTSTGTSGKKNDGDFKKITFGFNVGYFSFFKNLEQFNKPIEQIKKDSIFDIRAMDPFNRNKWAPEKIIDAIQHFTDQDIHFLLSLSNFPFPVDESKIDGWVKSVTSRPEYKNIGQARKDKYLKQIKSRSKWTNRFPPSNIMEAYRKYLHDFFAEIDKRGMMDKMSFEIGNEPNAPMYFWGDAADLAKVVDVAWSELKKYNRPVYCCGFTSRQVETDEFNPSAAFYQFTYKEPAFKEGMNLSFHMYMGKADDNISEFEAINHKYLANSIITESNAYSTFVKGTERYNKAVGSFFAYKLAQLLYLTYSNDIKMVYFHRLKDIDSPSKKGKTGFFDEQGNPKGNYNYLIKVWKIVKDGYKVEKTNDYIAIIGRKKTLKVALKPTQISVNSKKLKEVSDKKPFNGSLKTTEWIIYDNDK